MESSGPLRAVRSWEEALPDSGADRQVREAMLLTAGERGYGGATVREVCARAGITESRFHGRFGSKEACFAAAYVEAANELFAHMRVAFEAEPRWRRGFQAALAGLLTFVAEQPLRAKALLIEVKAARGKAWIKHQEMVERFTVAIDWAREEPGARPNANPIVGGFLVGAIEETLCIEIANGRAGEVERLLPDLTRLAFLQLFGEEAEEANAEELSPRSRPAPPRPSRGTASE